MSSRLQHFPISFFAMVLGLAGYVIAWQKMEELFNVTPILSVGLVFLVSGVFIILFSIYLVKIITYPALVKAEFSHPIKSSFFPTISISLLLLATLFLPVASTVSLWLWWVGASLQLVLTLAVISLWINHSQFEVSHMNPSWFIPAVGNIVVPVAGVEHGLVEISWFFFSIGIIFWLILLTIFFNRIIFHHPLPNKLLPTLFILIAPPAIGFISLVKLTGEVGAGERILLYFALFMSFLVFTQWRRFYELEFYLSWWAYSFPLGALTIANVLMFKMSGYLVFFYISLLCFMVLTTIIMILLYRTALAVKEQSICQAE